MSALKELAAQGHRFRNFIEQEGLTVLHRFLMGQPERITVQSALITPERGVRKRRPRDCPF
jgi:hypothetical protein